MLNAELLMFRWISRHTVIVEGWNNHHSTRLDEAVLMSCVKSFYDHWMLRYSMKRIFLIFNFEFWNLNQNCQIRSVLIGLNLNWSDFDQIQTDLNWSDQFKIFLNWIWTADRIYLIWSEFDRSDSDQIQSDQFFLGALIKDTTYKTLLFHQIQELGQRDVT